jgi:hypothetical protein
LVAVGVAEAVGVVEAVEAEGGTASTRVNPRGSEKPFELRATSWTSESGGGAGIETSPLMAPLAPACWAIFASAAGLPSIRISTSTPPPLPGLTWYGIFSCDGSAAASERPDDSTTGGNASAAVAGAGSSVRKTLSTSSGRLKRSRKRLSVKKSAVGASSRLTAHPARRSAPGLASKYPLSVQVTQRPSRVASNEAAAHRRPFATIAGCHPTKRLPRFARHRSG